jgi:hypothetical protein
LIKCLHQAVDPCVKSLRKNIRAGNDGEKDGYDNSLTHEDDGYVAKRLNECANLANP